jgi:hypothetical protein
MEISTPELSWGRSAPLCDQQSHRRADQFAPFEVAVHDEIRFGESNVLHVELLAQQC